MITLKMAICRLGLRRLALRNMGCVYTRPFFMRRNSKKLRGMDQFQYFNCQAMNRRPIQQFGVFRFIGSGNLPAGIVNLAQCFAVLSVRSDKFCGGVHLTKESD